MKGAHITKSVSGQRETRLRSGLKCLLVDSGKWIDNKLQPNKSRSGHHISCSLVSLHFLCGIPTSHTLQSRFIIRGERYCCSISCSMKSFCSVSIFCKASHSSLSRSRAVFRSTMSACNCCCSCSRAFVADWDQKEWEWQ